VSRDCPVIPVLLPNAPTKPDLPVFLRQFTWVDFRISDPDPMYQLRWGITGKKPQLTNSAPSPSLQISQSPSSFIETLPSNIKLEMVKIPAGTFTMGSDENDDEKPKHQVKLQEFYLGKYPVTQEQYQTIMGNNPSNFKDNPKNPVEEVTWNDAQEFCQKLSQKTGKQYRLPTEAEWEYACRAGTQTRYYFGDNGELLGEYAWYDQNSYSKTQPVGQKKPNNWGLHDMHGNVCEWCEDGWHENHENAPKDGTGWNDNHSPSSSRLLRGGSWNDEPRNCRSAYRVYYDDCSNYDGFRVVSSQDS
jgi:formylglycine-generating enzyme required for sulfatase activity